MNIYQKLLKSRIDFAKKNIQPSGYNGHADFDYLELQDIVPVANKIFAENGLCLVITFAKDVCQGLLFDTEVDEDHYACISFEIPHIHIAEPAKFRMNEVQSLGAEMTYIRRYMYMLVLDIVVRDEIDADGVDDAPAVKPAVKATPAKASPAKPKAEKKEEPKADPKVKVKIDQKPKVESKIPATEAERKAIAKELTNADGKADELQITKLKTLVSEWVHLDPDAKQKATDILVKTNGFADCTRQIAEKFIDNISKEIKKLKE